MSSHSYRSSVIRNYEKSEILTVCLESLYYRLYYFVVYSFEGKNLALCISLMTAFVRSLKVNIYEVFALSESCKRRICLALIIGVERTCTALYVY